MIVALTGHPAHALAGASRAVGISVGASPAKRQRNPRARTLRFGSLGLVSTLGALVFLAGAVSNSFAIGLGPVSLRSALGEPLRFSLPVTLQDGEDVGCVQVRPRGDDLPSVFNTRASVVQTRGRTEIEISSAQPVNEPAIGVVVSVGCASPVARAYVLFLDPPVIPALAESPASSLAQATRAPIRSAARPTPVRRASATPRRRLAHRASASANTSASSAVPRTAPRAAATPRAGTKPSRVATREAMRRAPPKTASTKEQKSPTRDGLTVVPTEPQKSAAVAGDPARVIAAAPTGSATLPAPSTASSQATASPPSPSATVPTASPPAAAPNTMTPVPAETAAGTVDAAAAAMAREEKLRNEQVELQKQVKALNDQISALRVQATTLSTRNQTLEATAFSPTLVWLLIALSVIAIAIAGWMALRYGQLRRSIDGSAWWSGNTVQAPTSGAASAKAPVEPVAAAIGTRLAVTPVDTRPLSVTAAAAAAAVSTSNVQDRPRPAMRGARYSTAIDTDFTVSDIEAAMATVRTVSPPRAAPRAGPLEETDFAALGGPTLPSPFADPPPPASSLDDEAGGAREVPESRTTDRVKDGPGTFVDLDLPPIAASGADRQAPRARAPQPSAPPDEESMPLDFKLDIPEQYDDPLTSNSMKTTIVDRPEPPSAVDFELPSAPTPLDFELPSHSVVMPLSPAEQELYDEDANAKPARHAATVLDDIFPSLSSPGVDTILNLDEEDGAPLITTEVDRLTTTEVEGTQREAQQASTRFRLARFADLMHQVDDVAHVDPLRAIAMLRQFVLRDEQIPTLLWLRLFELYKQVDKKPVYEALGEHFARRYHRTMVGWNESLDDRAPQTSLTASSEIDRNIESRWGSEEGLERLRSLLCDRNQPDAIVFNAVLQRDLLDAARIFPLDNNSLTDFGGDADSQSSSR